MKRHCLFPSSNESEYGISHLWTEEMTLARAIEREKEFGTRKTRRPGEAARPPRPNCHKQSVDLAGISSELQLRQGVL
jgi:hypothetical protein